MDQNVSMPFVPVKGKELRIKDQGFNDGYIYFATDSGKIFLDYIDENNVERDKQMLGGASVNILYASFTLKDENFVDGVCYIDKQTFYYGLDSSSQEVTIKVNDLIINSDGTFLQIIAIDEGENGNYECKRVAISGSGSGSGGGDSGGGEGSNIGTFYINRVGSVNYNFASNDSSAALNFTITAADPSGNSDNILIDRAEVYISGIKYKEIKGSQLQVGENSIFLSDYIPYFTGQSQNVVVRVYCDVNDAKGMQYKEITWKVTMVTLELKWDYDFGAEAQPANKTFTITWSAVGAIDKVCEIYMGSEKLGQVSIPSNSSTGKYSFTGGLAHGVYSITVKLNAEVGSKLVYGGEITHPIICYGDSGPALIAYEADSYDLQQYDSWKLKYAAYIPAEENNTYAIKIFIDDKEYNSMNVKNKATMTWLYSPETAGNQKITLYYSETEKQNIYVNVKATELNITKPEGIKLELKPSLLGSNDGVRQFRFTYNNEATSRELEFPNGYDDINGGYGYDEELGSAYIKLRPGMKMRIPYPLFNINASVAGKAFKMVYKATQCRNYDANILTCEDSVSKRGFYINAQNIKTVGLGNTSLLAECCEDTVTEFELDFSSFDNSSNKNYGYITFWIDGVPTNITKYTNTGTVVFDSGATEKGIIIGSDDAEIYIYYLSIYEKHLSDEEHLNCFIRDSMSSKTMMTRYNRNNILDTNHRISYQLLLEKNPECQAYVYNIPWMTANKSDKVTCKTPEGDAIKAFAIYDGYDTDTGTLIEKLSVDKFKLRVQGTSSAAYGDAAFNLDNDLGDTTYQISENSIPVDYLTNKVNVASSEGANNALNQAWYNDHQPWKCRLRQKNPNARDCMEFKPGVVFIKDRNQWIYDINNSEAKNDTGTEAKRHNVFEVKASGKSIENSGYASNPYPKMYAIGNMGNSKKNTNVFHDETNPYEFCIENNDNQEVGQWMTAGQGSVKYNGDDCYATFKFDDLDLDVINIVNPTDKIIEFTVAVENEDKTVSYVKQNAYASKGWLDGMDQVYSFRYPDVKPITVSTYDEEGEIDDLSVVDAYKDSWGRNEYVNLEAILNQYQEAQKLAIDGETLNGVENVKLMDQDFLKNESGEYIHPALAVTRGWYRLVRWMALNDPMEYDEKTHPYGWTGKPLVNKSGEPITVTIPEVKLGGAGSSTNKDKIYKYNVGSLDGTTLHPGGEFTHDTKEYRIAKMASECQDYLCMTSLIYHYLFIERHTMVDNVAKNTFWSTEDCIHWNLIKNYDNDTADGNDNQGKLTLHYGIECLDEEVTKNEEGEIVERYRPFNAYDSVWLHFIGDVALKGARKTLYNLCAEKGAWDITSYLKTFNEWQSKIPERCWIEDFYRKYKRPGDILGRDANGDFLSKLDGGKKTAQRLQFETYHGAYMDSYYYEFPGDSGSLSGGLHIRTKGTVGSPYIEAKLYADGYINYKAGSAIRQVSRVKRGEYVILAMPDNMGDATCDIAQPSNISGVRELYRISPKTLQIGTCKKLSELDISNTGLVGFDPSNNTMLETFEARNVKVDTGSAEAGETASTDLNFVNNISLRQIDTEGSTFGKITFAPNGLLQQAKLNDISGLSIEGLKYLVPFENDDDGISIAYDEGANKLTDLTIIDCESVKSLDIVEQMQSDITNGNIVQDFYFILRDVVWETATNNYVSGNTIPLLEFLLKGKVLNPAESDTHPSKRLTGSWNFTSELPSGTSAIDVYNKYINNNTKDWTYSAIENGSGVEKVINASANFPEFDLVFAGDDYLPKVSIYNLKGDEIVWSRRLAPGAHIDQDFLGLGNSTTIPPDGAYTFEGNALSYVVNGIRFSFNGQWKINNDIYIAQTVEDLIKQLSNISIIQDTKIQPLDDGGQQVYFTITLMDQEGVEGKVFSQVSALYESNLLEVLKAVSPPSSPLDESNLDDYMTYRFNKWKTEQGQILDLDSGEEILVTAERTLYATYVESHVYDNPLSEELYSVDSNGQLSIPNSKEALLPKKLVIPFKSQNGRIIKSLGAGSSFLQNVTTVSHVFFQPEEYRVENGQIIIVSPSQCNSFGYGAFISGSYKIYLPKDLINNSTNKKEASPFYLFTGTIIFDSETTKIPEYLCSQMRGAQVPNLMSLSKLEEISDYAFYNAQLNLDTLILPSSVKYIGHYAFYNCFKGNNISVILNSNSLEYGKLPISSDNSSANFGTFNGVAIQELVYTDKVQGDQNPIEGMDNYIAAHTSKDNNFKIIEQNGQVEFNNIIAGTPTISTIN